MRLLLDEQQDPVVAELLRKEDHDVVAVVERPELLGKGDAQILETATAEHRGVVSEDARDFTLLHRVWMDRSRTHYGIILVSERRFPRRKDVPRPLVMALRTALRANPAEDALRDQLIWLG